MPFSSRREASAWARGLEVSQGEEGTVRPGRDQVVVAPRRMYFVGCLCVEVLVANEEAEDTEATAIDEEDDADADTEFVVILVAAPCRVFSYIFTNPRGCSSPLKGNVMSTIAASGNLLYSSSSSSPPSGLKLNGIVPSRPSRVVAA